MKRKFKATAHRNKKNVSNALGRQGHVGTPLFTVKRAIKPCTIKKRNVESDGLLSKCVEN